MKTKGNAIEPLASFQGHCIGIEKSSDLDGHNNIMQ